MNLFLILIILSNFTFAKTDAGTNCVSTTTTAVVDFKEFTTTESICFSAERLVGSKKCSIHINSCIDNKNLKLLSLSSKSKAIGNPKFKNCYILNGLPQFFSYQLKGQKIQSSRCLFGDSQWIDLDYLYEVRRGR